MRKFLLVIALLGMTLRLVAADEPKALLQALKKASTPQEKADLLNYISEHYWESDPSLAVQYGLKAAKLCQKYGLQKDLGNSYNTISIGYYWQDNYTKATEYAYKSLTIRESIQDTIGLASSYNNIGNLYREQENYKKALLYFEKGLAIGRQLKKNSIISTSLGNIGTVYELTKQPQKALRLYLEVAEIDKGIGDKYELGTDYFNIGNLYMEMGKHDSALFHLRKSLLYSQETQSEVNLIYILRAMSYVHLKQKHYGKALEMAKQSLKVAQKLPSPEGIKETTMLLNEIYTATGDYPKAHHYLTLHTHYLDSLSSQNQAEAIAEINTKYETEKKEIEIKQLKAERELQKAKLAQKSNAQFAVAILFLLMAALAYVFFRGRRRMEAVNQQLSAYNQLILEKNSNIQEQANALSSQAQLLHTQKRELENLNQFKDKLFSIIAHDLRGPLISLQSLFRIMTMGTLPPEKMSCFMKDLEAQQQNTLSLLDNLLLWAKIQMKGLNIEPKEVSMQKLIQQNIQLLAPQAAQKGIVLQNQLKKDLFVIADEEMINLVFRNLISNAIKFCHRDDLVSISDTGTSPTEVIISVQDSGIGINRKNLSKLFGPNHFKGRGTANEKGSGLGLMLCKEFIQINHGSIWVESEERVGTTFYVSLPKAVAAGALQKEHSPLSGHGSMA
ncbi:hypothetical protein EFA69_15465 [Rufibacter immobilis]|uniref:histidine kinase n=1 Tax=Rufibacter immobilis TaxID=1348778 RepID=A0A3M9MRL0_9BACT|nr:tetratricopeptide repeat-containing sensor histidine kinase [Rufibacter immobilis]RNI27523.1 hypothetical protein EFA69_15465 [Rufibacter immobilis]